MPPKVINMAPVKNIKTSVGKYDFAVFKTSPASHLSSSGPDRIFRLIMSILWLMHLHHTNRLVMLSGKMITGL